MKLHRLNNVLHRDLGYFFAGATIIYALSGLAVNHIRDWNPNFVIDKHDVQTPVVEDKNDISKQWVLNVLEPLGQAGRYRNHDFPSSKKLKIYLDDGSLMIDLPRGEGRLELVSRRPLFYQINSLHLSPGRWWKIFADLFAVGLLILAVTGLFVLKGKNGIAGRGAILTAAGLLVPVVFMFLI